MNLPSTIQNTILRAEHICCGRGHFAGEQSQLRDVSLALQRETLTLVTGPAGCGRNLLVRVLGLLEQADSGEIYFMEERLGQFTPVEQAELTSRRFGYIFPMPYLLPSFTLVENVAMPLLRQPDVTPADAHLRTEEILQMVGLAADQQREVHELTLYEQQLVSLARALCSDPVILLAEDPGSDLTQRQQVELFEMAARTASRLGVTVLWSGAELLSQACPGRTLRMEDGVLMEEEITTGPMPQPHPPHS